MQERINTDRWKTAKASYRAYITAFPVATHFTTQIFQATSIPQDCIAMSSSDFTFDIPPITGLKNDTPAARLMGFTARSGPDGRLWCQWTKCSKSNDQEPKLDSGDWLWSFVISAKGHDTAEIHQGFAEFTKDKTIASFLCSLASDLLNSSVGLIGVSDNCWAAPSTCEVHSQGLRLEGIGVKLTVPPPSETALNNLPVIEDSQTEDTVSGASQPNFVNSKETVNSGGSERGAPHGSRWSLWKKQVLKRFMRKEAK